MKEISRMKAIGLRAFLPVLLFASSCRALEPDRAPGMEVRPGRDYMVLERGSPALLIFGEDVESSSVDALARIRRGDESLKISRNWSGRRLELHPEETVIPGREYRLELDGVYRSASGRERKSSLSRPFYWGSIYSDPLRITGSLPEDGGIIGREDALCISFSALPEPASLSRSIRISPSAELTREWNGRTLILRPEEGWANLKTYTLKLDGSLEDKAGRCLEESWSLGFYVESERTPPRVVQMAACSRDRAAGFPWILPAAPAPSYGQGIRLSFSRPMNRDAAERAFSLSPSLPGDLCWTGPAGDLAFIPEEGFDMGERYTLRLTAPACCASGLEMEEDFIREFTPAIPLMNLESLECVSSGGFLLSEYGDSVPQDLPVRSPSPYDLLFRFRFSRPFASEREKQSVQEGISLYEIFSGGGSPRPGLYAWENDRTVTVLYSGFRADEDSEYYYLIKLKGGAGGIGNDEGSYLKENISQLLRTPRQ